MGASLVKNCFGADCAASPRDYAAPPRRSLQQTPFVHHAQHHHSRHRQYAPQKPAARPPPPPHVVQHHYPKPAHPAYALDSYHAGAHPAYLRPIAAHSHSREAAPPRKLSPYDRFRHELQLRSAALPLKLSSRRDRWDSRESACSSMSSSTEEEMLAMVARHGDPQYSYEKEHKRRSSSRRSSAHVRSYASTAASEDSFYRSVGSCRSNGGLTPASSTNSSRRNSRVSSPSFGFEDLLPESYVLEELIGSGTTSKCYRCRRTTDGQAFACKIINKRRLAFDHMQHEDLPHQLRQEVDVLRRLDHPNIAKLEDSFENDTYILLMMELLDGGELFETIIERVRLTESDARHTARSILSAISYMHSQGIVHRDIKPENLLLATSASPGKPLYVKIVDFGFASCIHSRATMTSFLGTGGYLAPEVMMHHPYTAAVDTWAFGVLLYLLLCGRLPFTTATQIQPGQRLSSLYRLTFPDKYWRGVSSSARDLLTKLLVLNPNHRLTPAEALKHRWFQME